MVYGFTKLTIAQAFAAEDSYLPSELRISQTVQKWTEFERLP